jgi:hypothetical protein
VGRSSEPWTDDERSGLEVVENAVGEVVAEEQRRRETGRDEVEDVQRVGTAFDEGTGHQFAVVADDLRPDAGIAPSEVGFAHAGDESL